MLPAMVIEGLGLEDALRKLNVAYVDACRKSGEVPLPLTFSIAPPGSAKKLTLHLPAGNFSSSVRLLATFSGMKASRDGREFHFESLAGDRKQVKREFQVPPGFNSDLEEIAGGVIRPGEDPFVVLDPMVRTTVGECLLALGIDLDPSTHLTLKPSGVLALETSSAADAAAIEELAKVLAERPRVALKFTAKAVEISADSDWSPPDVSRMTDNEVQMLMRELSQKKGTELQTMPSVTCKNGQNSSIEMIQEVIYPKDDSSGSFEKRNTGKVLKLQGSLLGFGHEVGLDFTDTTVEYDPRSNKPTFTERTAMKETGFTSDGGTRLIVQTRPDGSKTVMLLNATMIDATGRPVH